MAYAAWKHASILPSVDGSGCSWRLVADIFMTLSERLLNTTANLTTSTPSRPQYTVHRWLFPARLHTVSQSPNHLKLVPRDMSATAQLPQSPDLNPVEKV